MFHIIYTEQFLEGHTSDTCYRIKACKRQGRYTHSHKALCYINRDTEHFQETCNTCREDAGMGFLLQQFRQQLQQRLLHREPEQLISFPVPLHHNQPLTYPFHWKWSWKRYRRKPGYGNRKQHHMQPLQTGSGTYLPFCVLKSSINRKVHSWMSN